MDENKSAVDEFLNEFSEENDPLGLDKKIQEEIPKIEDKPLPFHKDPKLQRYIEKEVAKRIPKVSEENTFRKETKTDEDDYYIRLIGNDTPEKIAMVREAKSRDERLLQQAEERAYGRISQEKQKELEAERQADEQLINSIDDIEETYNVDLTSKDPVARKTRVDFMTFVEKIAPKNAQGEISEFPDMLSAFETFQEMRKIERPNRAKDLASRSIQRSGGSVPKTDESVTFDNIDTFLQKIGIKK